MTHDAFKSDVYADEVAEGQCAVVAALVLALDEACVLPRQRYAQILHQLWLAMPDDQAVGGASTMVERVLGLVGRGAGFGSPYSEPMVLHGDPVGMLESIWPAAPPAQASPQELALDEAA